jgi:hypothetical protein
VLICESGPNDPLTWACGSFRSGRDARLTHLRRPGSLNAPCRRRQVHRTRLLTAGALLESTLTHWPRFPTLPAKHVGSLRSPLKRLDPAN